ncbi:hypothetical protein F8M41_013260 [Gigaspora margarita]|uniref:Uncharacterized protein n=1 Tax=Gigaspora margarita TaxID=4874 RepID=A0A8H4ASE2_GIGMA|nr:hypothetical protein F8M41_013260 [Gigaspora margarita]
MHGFSHYRRIKYIQRKRFVSPAHRSRRHSISPTYYSSQHRSHSRKRHRRRLRSRSSRRKRSRSYSSSRSRSRSPNRYYSKSSRENNVDLRKLYETLVKEIKTLKTQRVPASSPVEHESLNLLYQNDSSRSRSREYSSSSQCNNLYESHKIGSPSWYNELP